MAALGAALAGVVATPALAIYAHLNTTLSRPAINGVAPSGSANPVRPPLYAGSRVSASGFQE